MSSQAPQERQLVNERSLKKAIEESRSLDLGHFKAIIGVGYRVLVRAEMRGFRALGAWGLGLVG